jgi:hypothetical protein
MAYTGIPLRNVDEMVKRPYSKGLVVTTHVSKETKRELPLTSRGIMLIFDIPTH